MKNNFISRLLLLVVIITLHSCRNNELLTEQETYKSSSQFKLSSKTIRLDQSKHKLVLNTELQKAKSSLQKIKTNAFGKTVDYNNNILIDTDNVTYIENGPNFHTYTFNLIRENAPEDAPIENLVLAPLVDGTYKEILISYNLTAQEKKAILKGENISTKGKCYIMELNGSTFNPIVSKSQNCSWVEADSYTWCSEGVHHNGEGSGSCSAGTKSQLIKVTLLKCESIDDGSGNTGGGDGSGGSSGGGGNPGGGSGGGTPTEPCNGNGVATGPLDPSTDIGDGSDCTGIPTIPTLSIFFKYVKNLPADLKAVINDPSNSEFYEGLKNYYDINYSSDEAKQFITWAIQFKADNPSTAWEQFENWFIQEPILNNTLQNELFEDWADPNRVKPTSRFKNHTKLNGIYNKIKTAANFKQYLENFEPTFSVAHLMFDLDATQNPNALAETNPPSNYWIKIIFNKNKDWDNTPKAVIADTFMHEMIHAEIYRKLMSLASTNGAIDVNKITADLLQHNYPGLFDYYVRFTKGDADAQHQLMAAHYVNIMVNFLKQVYGSQYTDLEYRTIVWMGLQDTKAWSLLPEVDRKLYIKTWNENYWSWEK